MISNVFLIYFKRHLLSHSLISGDVNLVDNIKSHPSFPSLLSIGDFFYENKIDYVICNLSFETLKQYYSKYFVIILFNDKLSHILKISNDTIYLNNIEKIPKLEFKKSWNGNAIVYEKRPLDFKMIFITQINTFLVSILCLFLISSFYVFNKNEFSLFVSMAFIALSILGIIISIIIKTVDIGFNSSIASKVCV